ncbi:MAG: hypothetical protein KAS70_08130 [Planctomycetes bacterium]|nr:hypothetical protein [Planctomycetota bacterium]
MSEIRPIKFSTELQRELFPDNSFYKKSISETGIGIDVERVEIPQAASAGIVGVGVPGTLPLTITQRTDDIKFYTVQQLYMAEPIFVSDETEIVTNYNKRQDIITAMSLAINEKAADIAATAWGAALATRQVRTTDTAVRPTEIVGATGNRKRIKYDDLVAIRGAMNRQNAPAGSWWGLLSPAMVDDLFLLDKITDAERIQLALVRTGQVGMIFGIQFMMRWNATLGSNGISYDNTATPVRKALGAAVAATDNGAAIFWHTRLVRHAEGHAKTYIDRDKPEYLGSIMNSKVRFGATFNRTDEVGIVTLIETAG